MSLQVWLPLVKDFENYGVSGLKFQNFRYIRFVVNAIKGGSDNYTQLSRLEFLDLNGNLYEYPSGTTVSSSMTGYPASEPPASIIDGNVNTKFCAPYGGAGSHLTIALGSGETIDISRYSRFQWYTANDGDWRDPVSFEVQFSNDGSNFVKGAVVTNASITSTRYALAYTGNCFNASAGKIGSSCYYNNSYEFGGLYSDTKLNLGNKLSMCCWVNFSALTPNSALGGSMGGQHRYPNCTGMGLTLKYISSSTGYLSCNTGDGSNRTYNTYCGGTLLHANTWYHVAFTYDGSIIRFYVNGNLDGTHSYTGQKNVEDYVFLGAWSFEYDTDSPTVYGQYKLNGCINDFRIYDHVLSKKEVKLLSQGLVAHYQLKGMGSANYLKGAGKFLKDTPLVRNASDVSHMNDSYVYHDTSDIFAVLPSAGTYTFSTESDGIGGSHPTSGTTASQRLFSLWLFNISTSTHYHFPMSKGVDGRWYGTRTDLVAGTYQVRTNLYAADNVNYTVKIWNMKVSAGSYNPSDVWCPHADDELYNILNLGSMVGTDCSGYGNNLEQIGTIPIESGKARYGSCVNYNNSGYLRKSDFNMVTNQFTIAFWIKCPSTSNDQHFICGTFNNWTNNGFGMWRDKNGTAYSALYRSNSEGSYTGLTSFTPTLESWDYVAYVYTGTQGIHYKNGVEVSRVDGGSSGTVSHPVLYLGNSMFNGAPTSEIDQASMSDFRFYATALSASDIADLYKNSASLTKDGKLYAYDFHENKRNTIDRDGIVATGGFNDKAIPTYDMKVKALPDGSSWTRIHHLDVTQSKDWFANAAEVAKCTDKHNRYSRMGIVDKYKVGSEYEFMLTYPSMKKTVRGSYTELDYIETTGTQYIRTGVTGAARWEFDIQFTASPLIPTMTSNTAPSGTATIYGDYNSGQEWRAYYAFDGNNDTNGDVWYGIAFGLSTKVGYIFPSLRKRITRVKLRAYVDGGGSLSSGLIEYTTNGSTWSPLVTLTSSNFKNNEDLFFDVDISELIGIRAGATTTSNGCGIIIRELQIYGVADNTRQLMGYGGSSDEYWGCQTDGKYGLFAGSTIGKSGGRDTIVHDGNSKSLWVQNQTLSPICTNDVSAKEYQIFAIDGGYLCYAKLWRCKCIQGGTLIRDFIPARYDVSGEIGLLDTVNNVFYGNAGSGAFVAGYKQEYQWLDFIASTGTQYIDTGFKPNSDTRIVFRGSQNGPYSLYGVNGNGASFNMTGNGTGLYFYWGGQSNSTITNYFAQLHTFEQNKNVCYVDGSTYYTYTYSSWSAPQTMVLFARRSNTDGAVNDIGGEVRCHSCQIYNNGSLIRDYAPCVNPAGEVGLYDKVTKRFYGNNGTGRFLAGPTIKSLPLYNRWIQTSSPNASPNTGTGFRPISTSFTNYFTPITKSASSSSAVYSMNTSNNWWAPIGQLATFSGGIPAADGSTQYETELWVRTDRFADENQLNIYDGAITATDYIEI